MTKVRNEFVTRLVKKGHSGTHMQIAPKPWLVDTWHWDEKQIIVTRMKATEWIYVKFKFMDTYIMVHVL